MHEIKIRRATIDDTAFLAWVIYTAAQSHLAECPWCKIFNENSSRTHYLLERISQNAELPWSYVENFWIAEVNGTPAAAMCGFNPAQAKPLMPEESELGIAKQAFNYSEEQLAAMSERLAIATYGMPDDLPDIWGIESIAVLPEFRGKGLIDSLFKQLFQEGKQRGFKQAQVLCLIGNDAAQRVFERNGFSVLKEKTNREFEDLFVTPGAKLLVRNL